ncbi:MAG: hypothetical protein PUI16_12015 [Clostridia bacterium]|nr:hypothetical protein [Clostridia bacterium]MDY5553994.1 hypothetical protein [Blautia sp.]
MNGLHYTLAGEQRKQMAQVISEIIQEKVVYMRVPTCAYQIGSFTISKEGILSWTENTDAEMVKGVVAGLQMMGFTAKTELRIAEHTDSKEKTAPDKATEEGSVDSNKLTVENEKYAFRCFLLWLGFIGDEYKAARRVLLKNLTGNGAWKNGGDR